NLMTYMRIKMGNGESTLLWDDSWHVGGILKDRFPRVYALETSKTINVGEKLAHPSISHSFRRMPRGGAEQSQFAEFNDIMQQVILTPISDRWVWTLNNSGEFSVASVMTNSLATKFNILKRGIDINSISCEICGIGVETSSHLFFTCDMAQQVSRLINRWRLSCDVVANLKIFEAKAPN
nr:hypothetical protein [Tanacetum cinerariifolium]